VSKPRGLSAGGAYGSGGVNAHRPHVGAVSASNVIGRSAVPAAYSFAPGVAAQVDPFERHILKPGFHVLGARVETTWEPGAFQLWVRGSQRAQPHPGMMMMEGLAPAPPALVSPQSIASWLSQSPRTRMVVPG
jgi:hypothetical protein